MTLARLTWTPTDNAPETLIVDLPAHRIPEMQNLIGTPDWARSKAVMWIDTLDTYGSAHPRLYRLARIIHIEVEQQ